MDGRTRWATRCGDFRTGATRVRPLAEVSYGHVATVGGGVFDVEELYGGSHFWSLALGVAAQGGRCDAPDGPVRSAEEYHGR